MKPTRLIPALLALGLVPALQAALVFQDTFADGDRTASPAWYVATGGTVVTTVTSEILSLGKTSNNTHIYLSSDWAGTTLAVGDKLDLSFRVRVTDAGSNLGNRGNEFAFGVGNNNGTPRTADSTGTASADDFGYFSAFGFGNGASSIQRDNGTSDWLGRPGGSNTESLAAGTMRLTGTFKDITLSITRTGTGLNLSVNDGSGTSSYSDTSVPNPNFYTFNTVSFGYYIRDTNDTLDLDSISVTVIPEPSSMALVGILLGTLAMLRRRKA